MLYLDKDGKFQDTHEATNQEEIEATGNEIIGTIEEDFKDQVEINTWYESGDCCEAGTYWEVNWCPNLEDMIKEELEKYKDDPYYEEIEQFVRDNISDEDKLCEEKAEKYFEDRDDYDPN